MKKQNDNKTFIMPSYKVVKLIKRCVRKERGYLWKLSYEKTRFYVDLWSFISFEKSLYHVIFSYERFHKYPALRKEDVTHRKFMF